MAALQSVHILQYANGTQDPLFASTGTVGGISNLNIDRIYPATAKMIATYPSAITAIKVRYFEMAQQFTGVIIVTEAVAAVIAAS